MTQRKILPQNLPAIKKHFEKQRTDIKNKLRCLNRKKIELENELAICEDGIGWCERVYSVGKKTT